MMKVRNELVERLDEINRSINFLENLPVAYEENLYDVDKVNQKLDLLKAEGERIERQLGVDTEDDVYFKSRKGE